GVGPSGLVARAEEVEGELRAGHEQVVGRRDGQAGADVLPAQEPAVLQEVEAVERWEPAAFTASAAARMRSGSSVAGGSASTRPRSTSLTSGLNPPWARLPRA